jgi:hypothetical protein
MAGEVEIVGRWFRNQNIRYLLTCSSEGALVTMPYTTEQTHNGKFFFCNQYNGSIASSGNFDILLVTGSISPHLGVMVDISAAATLSIYEGVTYSASGSAISSYNANRTSTNTTVQSFYNGPTITGTGTALMTQHYIPGGSTGNASGGTSTDFARITEFILKTSTAYLFRVTNIAAGTAQASMQFGWFEST